MSLWQIVPEVTYADIKSGRARQHIDEVKKRGCIVVRSVVPEAKVSTLIRPTRQMAEQMLTIETSRLWNGLTVSRRISRQTHKSRDSQRMIKLSTNYSELRLNDTRIFAFSLSLAIAGAKLN